MPAMHDLDTLARHVHAAGGKITAQRTLIYRALDGDTSHPTAEELHARLLPSLPHLSLTTVYKTLNELVAWGELRRIDAGDGRIRFDPDVRPHAEVVCLRCHRVVDVPASEPSPALPAELAGFRIVRRAETYYGYCPRCRDAGSWVAGHLGSWEERAITPASPGPAAQPPGNLTPPKPSYSATQLPSNRRNA